MNNFANNLSGNLQVVIKFGPSFTYNLTLLKVSKSWKHFMVFSILLKKWTKNEKKTILRYLRIIFPCFSFVFRKNWEYHKLLSRFTVLEDKWKMAQIFVVFKLYCQNPSSMSYLSKGLYFESGDSECFVENRESYFSVGLTTK